MKVSKPNSFNTEYTLDAIPSIEVELGEEFIVETELCSGPWLKDENSVWTFDKQIAGNILNCIRINGVGFGELIKVRILSVIAKNPAYGGLEGPDTFSYPRLFLDEEYDSSDVRIIPLNDGKAKWEETLFEISPMIGCIGTARPKGGRRSDVPDHCGGNLDVSEVTTGTSVYLPVTVRDALLFIGDVHALQGDGEITGWGAECRGIIRLVVEKVPCFPFECKDAVLMENDDYWMASGFGTGFERAYNSSVGALLNFVAFASGRSRKDVYMRLGLAMRTSVAQSCFPEWPVFLSKFPKKYLPVIHSSGSP